MPQDEYTALRSAIRRMPNPVFVFDDVGLLRPLNPPAADLAASEHLSERVFVDRPSHPLAKILRDALLAEEPPDPGGRTVTLPSGRRVEIELSRTSEKRGARWLLLFVRDLQQSRTPAVEELAETWRFTPREAAVARHLLEGKTSDELCAVLGISRETLKSHLASMFGKTATRNRTELVAKLLK